MSDILKSIVQFADVPPSGVASLPHGINVKGAPEVPDHIEVNNSSFEVVKSPDDDINVTVRNTGEVAASVGVLCEMWHSIPRVFGGSFVGIEDSLSIRPYVPASGNGVKDEKVKASAADTTPGFLDQKLVQGDGVSLVLLNPGADEDVRISVSGADAGNITTAAPITVRGPTNTEGVGAPIARADHEHRLELEVEDEGALAGARPAINFVGAGVGAVDNPIEDRVDVTIPGAVTDGASVVRSVYSGTTVSSSLGIYVDAMSGLSVAVPIDGFYWGIFESDSSNQNANGSLEFGISVNSVLVALVDSERMSNGNANDERTVVTTVYLGALVAGDLIRALFRKASGAGSVSLYRKNLTIFKVQ